MIKTIRTETDARNWLAENNIAVPTDTFERGGKTCFLESARCKRCGGSGYGPWYQDGGRCYDCGGIDTRNRTVTRSLKRWAQGLKARVTRARKIEEEAAERAKRNEERMLEGQREWCEAHGYGCITFAERDAQREADRKAKAASKVHVGIVGERREFTATIIAIPTWPGYRINSTTYCHILEDADGNTLVWKTADNGFSTEGPWAEVGDAVTFKATIKEHGERRGEKQTVITRAKTISVARADEAAA